MEERAQQVTQQKAEVLREPPPGVRLIHTLKGHRGDVNSVAFGPRGTLLASAGDDGHVHLWELPSGNAVNARQEGQGSIWSVRFHPSTEALLTAGTDGVKLWEPGGERLGRSFDGYQGLHNTACFDATGEIVAGATSVPDNRLRLWEARTGKQLHTPSGHTGTVNSLAFDVRGLVLASGSWDKTVMLWDVTSGKLLHTLNAHGAAVHCVAFDPTGRTLVTGGMDNVVNVWDTTSWRLIRRLEGHTRMIDALAFSRDGNLLASKSHDGTVRLLSCDTWDTLAIIPEPAGAPWLPSLAFHPTLPLIATTANSVPDSTPDNRHDLVHVWEYDLAMLLRGRGTATASPRAVHHTTGKVIVVGDHSVGKSALSYRLINGTFKEQASTHGQQFWVFPALGTRRADGTDCEAILWDFAGQPDYRLVHALFVDDADLALVLFDASDIRDPLHGVGFWLKQLQNAHSRCPVILVAAQADRGTSPLTPEELTAFCDHHGVEGPIMTSALSGLGIEALVEQMKSLVPWDEKPATVTTTTFKRIKDYILGLKSGSSVKTIVTPDELRTLLEAADPDWQFAEAEMLTAIGHLENYGYVKRLRTSKGEQRVLLQPERLNNLASSFVLEARRNPKGLGALEERRLLTNGYDFPELADLPGSEREVILDAAALLFLEHNVCFRETDPLRMETYLVFPELINLKKPLDEDPAGEDGASYTVIGPTENVFASLVVLLGYTHTFTRTAQWQNNARYEVGRGLTCGFRQDAERDGELDFVLRFGPQVGMPVRTLFQGLFESFLARRNLTVTRHDPLRCSKGHLANRAVVREAIQQGEETTFCAKCGEQLAIPAMAAPIQLTTAAKAQVESQREAAEQRTRFEQAVFRLRAYVAEQSIKLPTCFISYAWGVPEQERWVEKRLAADLQKAGIEVLLDRWHNAQFGASVARFIERIEESEYVVVVGTPLYRQKAKNITSIDGNVAAAEWDLAGIRMLATEEQKRSVLPILLSGKESESFPGLLRGRVYADFRDEQAYFARAFDLVLSIYRIPPNHPAVADLRETVRGNSF
jgi:small GTP-binding protein